MVASTPSASWLHPDSLQARHAMLVADFERATGRLPVVVCAAPGRLNLLGEHVDYNGGRCLALALPHVTLAALSPRPDGRVRIRSLQQPKTWTGSADALGPGHAEGWVRYVIGVLWALQEADLGLGGVEVVVDGGVPMGAGLSSSAALQCSVALAVAAARNLDLAHPALRDRLVAACIRAEQEVALAPTGGLDPTVSLHAREGALLDLDFADGTRRQLRWAPTEAGLCLLVIDTRVTHALDDGNYGRRRAECEEAARSLGVSSLHLLAGRKDTDALAGLSAPLRGRVAHVLGELDRVERAAGLIASGRVAEVGPLLFAAHRSLRDDFEVSCDELDLVVEVAEQEGALGARMVGGGFGGACVALLPSARVAPLTEAVGRAFAKRGLMAPRFLEAPAAEGARRLDLLSRASSQGDFGR